MKMRTAGSILLGCFLIFLALTNVQAQTVAPGLSLKDSLPIAEEALTSAKLDLANYWLYSVTYANSSKGNYWYYTFRANAPSEFNQVFVKVYMNGQAEISGGPERA